MKKIFSLVALVGMFALMSFNYSTKTLNTNDQTLPVSCVGLASSTVSFWNEQLEGYLTLTESQQFTMFLTVYDNCVG